MFPIMWKKKKDSTARSRIHDQDLANRICSKYEERRLSCNFLDSCLLCRKPLSGKAVYMYMGEMGFCSVDCRSRQIYLDDMKKIEISTRRILASFHERRRCGGVTPKAAPPIFISK